MSKHSRSVFKVPEEPRSRTSDVLVSLISRSQQSEVTLRTLTDRLGDRTFGLLLIIVASLSIIPFVSIVTGLLISLLGMQMVMGVTRAWLPRTVLDRRLPKEGVQLALRTFEPRVRAFERYVRPRLQFTEAFIVDRVIGAMIVVLGIVIALPIPFANMIPALVVIVMGLGLTERDGLVQICAAILGIAVLVGIYLIVAAQ